MKSQKIYEPNDKMFSLIRDNYNILQSLGSFGIKIGFGDRTVSEVCQRQGVDTYTFLAVVNLVINDHLGVKIDEHISMPTLLHYLKASHQYYLGFQLPTIRRELEAALEAEDNLAKLILKLYDNYSAEIHRHMKYEEKELFPYVTALLEGDLSKNFDIDTFSQHHSQVDRKLRELKDIIIKYLPTDDMHNNRLMATLYDIYNNEEWLLQHSKVEDMIFIPAIKFLEKSKRKNVLTEKISSLVSNKEEELSARERDVIISIVQGMSNKEIAEHLCISTNTVITHRRNIARKLQIHTPAGLTIYAIVNGLVDISSIQA